MPAQTGAMPLSLYQVTAVWFHPGQKLTRCPARHSDEQPSFSTSMALARQVSPFGNVSSGRGVWGPLVPVWQSWACWLLEGFYFPRRQGRACHLDHVQPEAWQKRCHQSHNVLKASSAPTYPALWPSSPESGICKTKHTHTHPLGQVTAVTPAVKTPTYEAPKCRDLQVSPVNGVGVLLSVDNRICSQNHQ